ncbi:box C/D snoRNA protein 1 [Gouania willdenowi]|uniref:Box C/D snoRNA protein 1 n=1 Tax=Gouania willdenowi TaxID=441366 RepID=A0A8C5GKL9_GOUWI|nr:box C/D snoRNA protein 1 [Gouania willdenowi]
MMLTLEDHCGLEEEERGTKRKISLSKCSVCAADESKYKCPACLTNTCCLLCVKKHKEVSGCSGVRDKTGFVTLSHFDEMALLNDYRFLEDTGRFANSASRDNLLKSPRTTFKTKKLSVNARRMNITLRLLPVTFTKSRENSTIFISKEKKFLWHLKLVFPQSSSEFSQRRVPDTHTLEQILNAYIHPTESDPVKRQRLKMYALTPFNHIKVFMKAEGRKGNSVRYHEMEMQKSLRDNLSYKTLIEYPVLHVVLRDHWEDFPLKGTALGSTKRDEQKKPEKDLGSSPIIAPPQQKKAKIEGEEDEREEGEITESDDDDDGRPSAVENKTCGEENDDADHMKAIKDEVKADNNGQSGSEKNISAST